MDKFLLFTTGGGYSDPMNYDSSEAALYSVSDLKGIKPINKSNVEMLFTTFNGNEVVTLTIIGGTQTKVIRAISEAITSGVDQLIRIADVDNNYYINKNITGVSIKTHVNYIQRLVNNSRTQLTVPKGKCNSCIITNRDGTDAVDLSLELYDGSAYDVLLATVSIPADTALKLDSNEISFDNSTYNLYATSGDANGQLTFTFHY